MGHHRRRKRLILNRIEYTQDLRELSKADLLVEATLDHLDVKYELLRTADQLCRRDVYFLSATSTLKVSDLAKEINRSDMLVGLHFIPPVPDVAVAELVRGVRTSDEAVEVAKAFAARLGKQVVEIEESQGLVNPRALVAMINEAAYLLDEGVCRQTLNSFSAVKGSGPRNGGQARPGSGVELMEQLQMVFGPICPVRC